MDGTGDHHAEQDKPSLNTVCSHSFEEPKTKMMMTIVIMGYECTWGTV
jgi:hypothetical protein